MGEQIKAGASAAIRNSVIYDNPIAMGQMFQVWNYGFSENNYYLLIFFTGFPAGFNTHLTTFGRGGGGVLLTVSPGLPGTNLLPFFPPPHSWKI
jgi:hypothetical protein